MSPPDFSTQDLSLSLQNVPFNPLLFDEAIDFAKSSILSFNTSLNTAPSSFLEDSIFAPAWVDRSITHSLDDSLDDSPSLSDHGRIPFPNSSFSSSTQPSYTTTFSPNYINSSPTLCDQFSPCSGSDSTLRSSYLDPSLLTIQPINESHGSGGDQNEITNFQEELPEAFEDPNLLSPSSWEQEDRNTTFNAHDVVLSNFGGLAFSESQITMPDSKLNLQAFQNQRLCLYSSESELYSTGLLTDSPTSASTPAMIVDGPSPDTSLLVPNQFPDPNIGSSQTAPPLFQSANHQKRKRGSGKFLVPSITADSLDCPSCDKSFTQANELK